MAKTLMENIETFIRSNKKKLSYTHGKSSFNIEVKEDVEMDLIFGAIDLVVKNVVDNDFAYELIDPSTAYCIIELFTNIPVPMNGDTPDYRQCYEIVSKMGLIEKLMEVSPYITDLIVMIEKNVWRKLEYHKAKLTLVPWESIMDGLNQIYEFIDSLDNIVGKGVDIESVANQLNDISSTISAIKEKQLEK